MLTAMEKKICVICGRSFIPGAKNAKYCSGACADKGYAMRRREWEQRSGYLQKQRERAQKRRDAIRAAAEEERTASARIEAEARERSQIEDQQQRQKSVEQAAAAGDPLARMAIAMKDGGMYSAEYWSAWRDYDLKFAEASGKVSKSTVNEICVTESDFPQLVVESIKQIGKIGWRISYEKAPY